MLRAANSTSTRNQPFTRRQRIMIQLTTWLSQNGSTGWTYSDTVRDLKNTSDSELNELYERVRAGYGLPWVD